MKFKFKYSLEAEYNNVVYEAKKIYNKYFGESSKENKYLSQEILNNVRKSCEMIDKGQCNYEMFDSLLVNVFEILKEKFTNFQSTEEYRTLVKNLNMNSYIQYKICSYSKMNSIQLSTY
jgi:vacuolar-type H+-ATPase subunit E/Vma4